MTRDEFIRLMLEKGKITQKQAEAVKAKKEALDNYRSKGATMTKAEMQAVLDVVTGVNSKVSAGD